MTMFVNYIVFLCFYMFSEVQSFAWKSKFINISDPAVQMQFSRIQTSTRICLLINSLIPLLHILCVCKSREWIYVLRRMLHPPSYSSLMFFVSNEGRLFFATSTKCNLYFGIDFSHLATQHVVHLLILNRYKPRHFYFFEFDNDETSPSNITIYRDFRSR
jgi:hypothetical protein